MARARLAARLAGNWTEVMVTLVGALALAGCVVGMPHTLPPPTSLAQGTQAGGGGEGSPVSATRISGMEAVESAQGARITLRAKGRLEYQVYQLSNPPRLLLSFPAASLGPGVQPQTVDLSTITGLFPKGGEDGSSKLEVTLRGMSEYEIDEQDDGLSITIKKKDRLITRSGPQIQDLRVSLDQSGTHIHLMGTGPLTTPQTFRLYAPPRLVVDFFGLSTPVKNRHIQVDSPEVKTLQLANGPKKARLMVDLASPQVAFRIDEENKLPVIHLTNQTAIQGVQGATQVQAVDFDRDGADGVIRIGVSQTGVVLDSRRDGEVLELILKGATIPENLVRRMDVSAFGGPVTLIDAYPLGNNVQVIVNANQATDRHEILQIERNIWVRFTPSDKKRGGSEQAEMIYTGEKISMDFKDIDIQNALRLIAEITEFNMILSDSVKGTITMRLVEVPWDQALDLMLEAKGLGKVLQGNVLRIAPLAEIQSMAQARLQARQSKQELEPYVTELIPVSFAKAGTIRTLLMEGDAAQGTRLLSKGGTVSIDQRTNTLIVKDMASAMGKIREMVAQLDKPIPQVLIEARIVEVDRSSTMSLGINWGFNYKPVHGSTVGVSDSIGKAYETHQDITTGIQRRPYMSGGNAPPGPLNVNLLGNTPANIGAHLGSIGPLLDLDIELGALENDGKAKTISSPRVLTTDNQAAKINQGVSQPYPTESSTGGVTYSYIEATLSLSVTPHVTPNGYITLEVQATNNSLGTAPQGSPPPINTKEIKTQALVKNGQTIVLGGIFQNTQIDDKTGIPALSDIPYLGWMFKNKSVRDAQSELLIFITPRIISSS